MKKFKKIIAMCLTATMALPMMSVGVFANEKESSDVSYAYMDYASATDEVKELILEARSKIVYAPDARWTVDGQVAIANEDGTLTTLPEFDEIYPSDWNLEEITAKYEENLNNSMTRAAGFSGMVDVPAQSDQYAVEFYQFTGASSTVQAWAETLPPDYTINFGFRNVDTNVDVGWAGNLPVGRPCYLTNAVSGVRYAVRCSSSTGGCNAWLCVQDI